MMRTLGATWPSSVRGPASIGSTATLSRQAITLSVRHEPQTVDDISLDNIDRRARFMQILRSSRGSLLQLEVDNAAFFP